MKSEITALVYNFNCDDGFTNQTDQKNAALKSSIGAMAGMGTSKYRRAQGA